jgi:hypothetical protein
VWLVDANHGSLLPDQACELETVTEKSCRLSPVVRRPRPAVMRRVVGNMKKDTEIREEGLVFMFNTWPDLFSCEVEDED